MIASADDAVRLWWKMKARLETSGSIECRVDRMRVCSKCGWHQHGEVRTRRGELVDRCTRCRAKWLPRVEYGLAETPLRRFRPTRRRTFDPNLKPSAARGVRPDALQASLVRYSDLDAAMNVLPEPDVLAYTLYLVGDDDERRTADSGREAVAARLEELAPDPVPTCRCSHVARLHEKNDDGELKCLVQTCNCAGYVERRWTEKRVRWCVKKCRRLLERELVRRRLLAASA